MVLRNDESLKTLRIPKIANEPKIRPFLTFIFRSINNLNDLINNNPITKIAPGTVNRVPIIPDKPSRSRFILVHSSGTKTNFVNPDI